MGIALGANHFGGVMGLLILWYAALVGPIAIPMLFGMLKLFERSGAVAAISSWCAGALAFGLIKFVFAQRIAALPGDLTTTITVGGPVLSSLFLYIGIGLLWPSRNRAARDITSLLNDDTAKLPVAVSLENDPDLRISELCSHL
jgi:SSS family solute:Na+ symporter